MSVEDLLTLMYFARLKNEQVAISGMLFHHDGEFLQLLEGPERAVEDCFAAVAGDGRHADVSLLVREEVGERLFPDWSMGFEHIDDHELAEVLEGFAPTSSFQLLRELPWSDPENAVRLFELYAREHLSGAEIGSP